MTVLFHNQVTLLKVRNMSGEWISAPPIPGSFICNIGDMLKVDGFLPKDFSHIYFVCLTFN